MATNHQLSIRPCLFVAVGTSGWRILHGLRQLLYEEFGRSSLPCFHYIAIESDLSKKPDYSFISHVPANYENVHSIYLSIPDVGALRNKLDPKNEDCFFPGLADWLDPSLLDRGNKSYTAGAGLSRQAGRLCLWTNWNHFTSSVNDGLNSINQASRHAEADEFLRSSYYGEKRRKRELPADSMVNMTPKVYVFGTLCGGTCSGAFIDIAYYISHQLGLFTNVRRGLRQAIGNPEVIGLFTIIDSLQANDNTNRAATANCWSAMRELDFYCNPECRYSAAFPDETVINTHNEPFDTLYVESLGNATKSGFDRNDFDGLAQMCSLNLFTETTSGLSTYKQVSRVNDRMGATGYLERNKYSRVQAFCSFGVAAFWYPKHRIVQAINRQLAEEMCTDWLEGEVSMATVEQLAAQTWATLWGEARSSLIGSSVRSHCPVNIQAAIESAFAIAQSEIQSVEGMAIGAFFADLPQQSAPFVTLLNGPDGQYFLRISNAEPLVFQDLKHGLTTTVFAFLKDHSFAESKAYLASLMDRIARTTDQLPQELQRLSQQMDTELAKDIFADWWTKALGRHKDAVREYKATLLQALEERVIAHLHSLCDYFARQIIRELPKHLEVLRDTIAKGEVRLQILRRKWERDKAELIGLMAPRNLVIITANGPNSIKEDVRVGTKAILRNVDRRSLRRLFAADGDPLRVLISEGDEALDARMEREFSRLSDGLTEMFPMGTRVLGEASSHLRQLIECAAPYVEVVASFRPVPTTQSPNFLCSSEVDTAHRLVEAINQNVSPERYEVVYSPMEHFIIIYNEFVGLAISDFAIAESASRLLLDREIDPNRIATTFTHKRGEKMFNPKSVQDFEVLKRWVGVMRDVGPELFKMVGGEMCLEFVTRDRLKRDLPIENDDALSAYVVSYGPAPLIDFFSKHLRKLGQSVVVERMDKRRNNAKSLNARQVIQDGHENILSSAFAESPQNDGISVIVSYSHKDEILREQLEAQLRVLQRQGLVRQWTLRTIMLGDKWTGVVDEGVESAELILLLVSADFLASDYCYETELKIALARHSKGEAAVVPIILRACDWLAGPLGKLQVLPKDGRAITSWSNQDEAWSEVASGLKRLLAPPVARSDNLIVKRVMLRNIRCFSEIEIDLTAGSSIRRFLLLLGDNSVGKTTVLRSLAIGLCDENAAAGLMNQIAGGFLRDGSSDGSIIIELASEPPINVWRVQTNLLRAEDGKVSLVRVVPAGFPTDKLFVCGYGAARRNFGTSDYSDYAPQHSLATLFNYEGTMQNPELVLRRIFGRSVGLLEITRQIDEVMMLPPGSTTMEESGIKIRGPWGDLAPIGALGDGYQATVAWIVDLLGWVLLHDNNSQHLVPSGIVLIDEIDQHLHPSWQREIIKQLHQQFPKVQFIATSHAPMCALGMTALNDESGGLVTLTRSGECVEAGTAPMPKGKRADEVLTSPLFGLFSASAFDVSADLEKLAGLMAIAQPTPLELEEREMLRARLRNTLGPFRTELERRVHEVAKRGMENELREGLSTGRISSELLDLKISEQVKSLMGYSAAV